MKTLRVSTGTHSEGVTRVMYDVKEGLLVLIGVTHVGDTEAERHILGFAGYKEEDFHSAIDEWNSNSDNSLIWVDSEKEV